MFGHPREVAMEVWKLEEYFRVLNWALNQLINRRLMKEDVGGCLSMYDLLRDVGWTIVMEAQDNTEIYTYICNL